MSEHLAKIACGLSQFVGRLQEKLEKQESVTKDEIDKMLEQVLV